MADGWSNHVLFCWLPVLTSQLADEVTRSGKSREIEAQEPNPRTITQGVNLQGTTHVAMGPAGTDYIASTPIISVSPSHSAPSSFKWNARPIPIVSCFCVFFLDQ